MSDNLDFFYKLELYNFDYTDKDGTLSDYIVGKSIVNNTERFISSVSINPNKPKELALFKKFARVSDSLDGKTIGMDPRLLNDEVMEILKDVYHSGHVLGVRLIPKGSTLDEKIFKKFNTPDFDGFLLAADIITPEVKKASSKLEIVDQAGIFTIEHITYQKTTSNNDVDNEFDNYNIHIDHKLTDEEVEKLVNVVNDNFYDQIYVDFYDPSYYKSFLNMLKKHKIDEDVVIRFIGNPLYDEIHCFDGMDDILPNEVNVNYNTCRETNEFYNKEPHTEGVDYYTDIEYSGLTDSGNYYEMLKISDQICDHMEEMGYSPLEKIAYLEDYFKNNFVVDNDYVEDKQLNDRNDKIYRKDDLVIKGFAGLYSTILRKSGVLCYTYGTDLKSKNIVRVKDEKYGVDNLALIDTVADLDESENGFNSFLVPIDNDVYAKNPEVISIPTSLVISSDEYDNSIENSNPIYTSNPLGYAVRMLQLMGFGYGDRKFKNMREEEEFYKSALSNSPLIEEIPYDKIANAVSTVRENEQYYKSEQEKGEDFAIMSRNLQTRGNDYYVAPAIKVFGPPEENKDVELFKVFASDEFDKHFVEMPNQNDTYNKPRKIGEDENLEDYNNYLKDYYEEEFHKYKDKKNKVNGVMRSMKEYVTDNKKVDEVVLYRDVNDSGRVYATKEVFERFGYETPRFVVRLNNEKLYEMRTADVIQILNSSINSFRPYYIQYKYISINDNIVLREDTKNSSFDKYHFFKRINQPGKLYIKKEFADRLSNNYSGNVVMVGDVECYEIGDSDVLYIDDNNKKVNSGSNSFKKKLLIYRDINRPNMLYLRKDSYEKFGLKTDVEEVNISGIPCCVLDQGDLNYIVKYSNNSFNPYDIEYKDIEIDVKNMKPIYSENPTEIVKIYRNVDDQNKYYIKKDVFEKFHFNTDVEEVILSGVSLYAIDDNDLAIIISNASNRFNPYQISIIDIKLDSKNMKPAQNDKAVDEVVLYRVVGDDEQFYMDIDVFHRFGLKTPVEEKQIGEKVYYLIDKNDLEYIVRNANNKIYPYKISYKDLPVEVKNETASDLLDEELIPGTNFRKPRNRGYNETDEEYVSYLENYYKEIFGIGNQLKK